ncbi:hypothetical protein GYH30_024712 [Glycine max]|nr:hypothetical protein GYH30_024712 [Glycine max]
MGEVYITIMKRKNQRKTKWRRKKQRKKKIRRRGKTRAIKR